LESAPEDGGRKGLEGSLRAMSRAGAECGLDTP